MVDTGNSYEGLCEYLGGKYISYTEENPITMNPFRINRAELNVEKTGFLKNLVLRKYPFYYIFFRGIRKYMG